MIALVLLLAVALVYIKFTRGDWKRTLYRMTYENAFSFSLVNFLIGLYLWFVTDQVVPVLSARIWFLFWFIEMIVWAYFIHKDYQKVPDRRRELEGKKDIKKYTP